MSSSGSGGLVTFARDGFAVHVVSSDPRVLVVELRNVVLPLCVANVYRSARVGAAVDAGTRLFNREGGGGCGDSDISALKASQ